MRITNRFLYPLITLFICCFSLITNASVKEYTLKGLYLDSNTGLTVEGVKVCVVNTKSGAKTTIYTDQEGKFVLTLNGESDFTVHGTKKKYFDQKVHSFSTIGKDVSEVIDVTYTINEVQLNVPYMLNTVDFEINSVFRIKNSDQIDALGELLKDFPDVTLYITVHSDSRGADEFNKEMTRKRAEYIRELLMAKGLLATKLVAQGAGESELLNECGNGVRCSNQKHLENRRIEFLLVQE
ncbi:OmpA family protein [Flammeovirga aprica]|uniref:OmpA family protein n=1 Tax=Flammeovirga aprica JL-4 TaxID=694437 RepID=A0A7X9P344_9BACT|nr:OmpA family protein [Flammeovirga aprica]NME68308.1 OmpA family protein [Flammeovirga aprica JL-4]